MNRFKAAAIVVAMASLVIAPAAAQKTGPAHTLLEAARQKETLEGDLASAIKQYQAIVSTYSKTDRVVAATALLRMADCFQKLGDAQARNIYEQIVREYADQREAVTVARAQLGTGNRVGRPGEMTLRKVWAGNYHVSNPSWRQLGTVSADGRHLSYSDQPFDTLFLHDPRDGTKRPLTARTPGDEGVSQQSAISRDGTQIAFNWLPPNNVRCCELRLASLKGNGVPPPRLLFKDNDVGYITPMDWSPDAKWIAVILERKDRTKQIGLVSVQDGSPRVLKSVDWRGPIGLLFSPDGRDVLFDLPASDEADQRDVFVLAIDGSREIPAVVHPGNDIAMGWSPDGKHLLFASDRNGSNDLWALPFSDRRPAGPAELVKANIGNAWSMGVTAAGALYMGVHAGDRDIEIASIDLNTGKAVGGPVKPIQRFTGTNEQPAWSPDGKSLAYFSARGPDGHGRVVIQSVDTGQTRELHPQPVLSWFVGLSWAPDGRSFAVLGGDLKGRDGVFSIDAHTGQVAPIVIPISIPDRPTYDGFSWSPDQKRLYYQRQNGTIVERDLAAGQDRILASQSSPADSRCGFISLSPDGRWIATCRANAPTKSQALVLIPVDGRDRRELLRVTQPQTVGVKFAWTPDSRGILASRTSTDSPDNPLAYHVTDLSLVSTAGEPPRTLDFDASRIAPGWLGWRLNPDGRQLAFVSGLRHAEIWVLENFLPAVNAKK